VIAYLPPQHKCQGSTDSISNDKLRSPIGTKPPMQLHPRKFLHLTAGAAALAAWKWGKVIREGHIRAE
jgi:hypothetical protein